MPVKVPADLRRPVDPLARTTSPLSIPPPRSTRFGSPLVLSRVHWVEPVGLREDKPAEQVRREVARGE
jgi:hypothetical protein